MSNDFFEVSSSVEPSSGMGSRLLCVKDFLKRLCLLPLALFVKGYKTVLRLVGIVFSLVLVLLSLGAIGSIRKMFITRVMSFAKDLADWVLFPFAVFVYMLRLLVALLIRPNFYFTDV